MDKVKINNQIVLMRKFSKQAKVHAINKLVKEAKLLQNRKGTDVQVQKAKRKGERYLEEVKILKAMKPDHVSKMALSKAKDWKEVLQQKGSTLEERCLAILAHYPAVQKAVENFYSANSNLGAKIPDYLKEWEEKSRLPKELRKNKKILNSSNFTNVNKGEINLKNKKGSIQKYNNHLKNNSSDKISKKEDKTFIDNKVQKTNASKNNMEINIKPKFSSFGDQRRLSHQKETDTFINSKVHVESLNHNDISNVSLEKNQEVSYIGENLSDSVDSETDEHTKNHPETCKNMSKMDTDKEEVNISVQNDFEINVNSPEYNNSEIDDNSSENNDSEDASEYNDSEVCETYEHSYSVEKPAEYINSEADEIEQNDMEDSASEKIYEQTGRDIKLSSYTNFKNKKKVKRDAYSNKRNANSETNTAHSEKPEKDKFIMTPGQASESIIKSSTKNHLKAITMLNLDDLEGFDEIPIEKTSEDEIEDTEVEKNADETNDPFFLRYGETAHFDNRPETNSFSPKEDRSDFHKRFNRNEKNFFQQRNIKRDIDNNRSFTKDKNFRNKNFQNKNFNVKKDFQRSDFGRSNDFSRERYFNKDTVKARNEETSQFKRRKEFQSERSFNKKGQSNYERKFNKQFLGDNSKNTGLKEGSSTSFKKFQGKRGNDSSDAPLHPSWEAKKKQKEMAKASFQGKRMVFND